MQRKNYLALFVHLVWATWDREPLLRREWERPVYRAIAEKCDELGARVIALGGVEDHLHLLVLIPSTLTVAELVGQVKGVSSHLVNHQLLAGGDGFFKWQGNYGAFSVSPQLVPTVSKYIRNQREHHAAGSVQAEWERTQEEVQSEEWPRQDWGGA
jgi:putative transposase